MPRDGRVLPPLVLLELVERDYLTRQVHTGDEITVSFDEASLQLPTKPTHAFFGKRSGAASGNPLDHELSKHGRVCIVVRVRSL